jgi:hypothetical protein
MIEREARPYHAAQLDSEAPIAFRLPVSLTAPRLGETSGGARHDEERDSARTHIEPRFSTLTKRT